MKLKTICNINATLKFFFLLINLIKFMMVSQVYFSISIFYLFTDIDECKKRPCGNNATCQNTVGSFSCSCSPDSTGDPFRACVGEFKSFSHGLCSAWMN